MPNYTTTGLKITGNRSDKSDESKFKILGSACMEDIKRKVEQ